MSLLENSLIILLLIATSAFFAVSEIALAAARKIKLEQLLDEGEPRAARVLALQAQPGHFFTAVQIGLNAVAILAGVLGEGAYAPSFAQLFTRLVEPDTAQTLGSLTSFLLVTVAFVLVADLIPKRIAIVAPEAIALRIAGPMVFCLRLLTPLIWALNGIATLVMTRLGLPATRPEDVTPEDIVAMANAGAEAGVVARQERQMIENVFELEIRTAPSTMTARESIVWLEQGDSEENIRATISAQPHAKFPVCTGGIDHVIGYVDSKDILSRLLDGKPLALRGEGLLRNMLILPETLTLAEIIEQFKAQREDFALIINEYALIVGLITLNDVTSTLMGNTMLAPADEQIIQRDVDSWLVDGMTPVGDLETVLGIEPFPDDEQFETIAGFLMYTLRKLPRPTDSVEHAGFKFEVIDVDNHKIDQLLVTRIRT
ncbi:hemolysin family protein [Quatrionicoccus australiensis]|uniref:hemolysin family protein n=1 Tax=Quatrionicoccus australiensis TaxID=138118 RepID=UPI001CF93BE7|nr:hemolysin family protein [Quatrionicoccus australiensis]MCB4361392.1 HlyC/CorC family transporter [Quatrionicoccus australiensis]